MHRNGWFLVAALLAATAGSTAPAYSQGGGYAPEAVVTTENVGNLATVGGTVIPYKEVTLSAQIPGEVKYLAGAEGDEFTQNTLLIKIDDESILAQRQAALAGIHNAQLGLRNAHAQYGRELISPRSSSPSTMPGMGMPTMFDSMFTRGFSNMMGQSDTGFERGANLIQSGTGVGTAHGQLRQAEAQLRQLDASLKDANQVAPFDGVIVQKFVEVGDTVQPGMPILKYAHVKYLRIKADIPVRLVTGLRKGMMVPAILDVRGDQVQARVSQIYPVADASRHTVTVKFDLPRGSAAAPGMYAEVRIPDAGAGVTQLPVIPEAAVIWRGSLPGVFVRTPDGGVSLRLLRLGVPVGEGRVSVLAGLQGGEHVVLNPHPAMTSGGARPPQDQGATQAR